MRLSHTATLFVPPLLAVTLLYHVLSELQVTVRHPATLTVIAVVVAGSAAAGLLATFAGTRGRVVLLSLCLLAYVDLAYPLPSLLDAITPSSRAVRARYAQRVGDVRRILAALRVYVERHGRLPMPASYGEGTGPETFWAGWWDVSSHDGDGDGTPFLDFLVDDGIMPSVPVDPLNEPPDDAHPAQGRQYAFLVVPAGHAHQGGLCADYAATGAYVLGVTDLERQETRPPRRPASGCSCLWVDSPDFFAQYFDHVACGPAAQADEASR